MYCSWIFFRFFYEIFYEIFYNFHIAIQIIQQCLLFLGLGFGLPLLLDLPEAILNCGKKDFYNLIEDYGLERGLQPLLNEGQTKEVLLTVVEGNEV